MQGPTELPLSIGKENINPSHQNAVYDSLVQDVGLGGVSLKKATPTKKAIPF
ncbi:MAG: hypothetical protein ACI9BD_000295 [Candidatus Marinamargulisbacteria bacterium]|jgi:hypothetical protein